MPESLGDRWGLPSKPPGVDRGRLPAQSESPQLERIFEHIASSSDDAAAARHTSVSELRSQLKNAAGERPIDKAARGIEEVWSDIDELSGLSEAQMRLIIREVEAPALGGEPEWLARALDSVNGDGPAEIEADARALESARLLIRAVALRDPTAQAELDVAPSGGVEVTWTHRGGGRMPLPRRWIVGSSRLPWPGVRVRVYERRRADEPRLDARTHFLASTLVREFLKP